MVVYPGWLTFVIAVILILISKCQYKLIIWLFDNKCEHPAGSDGDVVYCSDFIEGPIPSKGHSKHGSPVLGHVRELDDHGVAFLTDLQVTSEIRKFCTASKKEAGCDSL